MKLAVFCGSAKGNKPIYEEAALSLAEEFLKNKVDLVYGGGSIGLMGVMADEMLAKDGLVYGIIPRKIYEWEVGHEGITSLEIVNSMHERKARMADLSDGFIAMAGGIGTLDEFIEIFTWLQLGYHEKPIGILNTKGYFDKLLDLLNFMTEEGFLSDNLLERLVIKDTPEPLVRELTKLA